MCIRDSSSRWWLFSGSDTGTADASGLRFAQAGVWPKHLTWLTRYFRLAGSYEKVARMTTAERTRQWDQMWLPLWPLASDNLLTGVYRQARGDAMRRRYIEANPQALSNLLVVDIDHEDAAMRTLWHRQAWWPNAVVENPSNGHAHAVWALSEPITRTEYGRRKPLAYAAAITEGLRRSVDGDAGYSGLMTKNPSHDDWDALWLSLIHI